MLLARKLPAKRREKKVCVSQKTRKNKQLIFESEEESLD
jgi:hypothetical protein